MATEPVQADAHELMAMAIETTITAMNGDLDLDGCRVVADVVIGRLYRNGFIIVRARVQPPQEQPRSD